METIDRFRPSQPTGYSPRLLRDNRADALYEFAFCRPGRVAHSEPFKRGAYAMLLYRYAGYAHPVRQAPFEAGTVAHDAWRAGVEYGRFLANMRGDRDPAIDGEEDEEDLHD